MKTFMKMTAVTVAAVAAAGAVHAGDMTPEQKQAKVDEKFAMMDTNKDGLINQSESTAAATKMFNDADTNDDNLVSKAEKLAALEKEWAKK